MRFNTYKFKIMKKLLLVAVMVITGFTANAQGKFNVGANVGLPLGDISKSTKFMFSVESNYLFEVSDQFKVGPSVSYLYFVGKSADDYAKETLGDAYTKAKEQAEKLGIKFDKTKLGFDKLSESLSFSVLPVAAAARFNPTEQFVLGADLGYAIGLKEGSKGSFYYRPVVGYSFGSSTLQLAYSGFEESGAVTLGVVFGF